MLGFTPSSFTPSFMGSKEKEVTKKILSRPFPIFRFLIHQQSTFGFRNSRRILEIGASSLVFIDFTGAVRAEHAPSEVVQVKILNDNDAVTLQFGKSSETFTCGRRAELLSALLPVVQKDDAAPVFTLSKWSTCKRTTVERGASESFCRYKLWAGRLLQKAETLSTTTTFEILLVNITKVCTLSDDPAGAVLYMKNKKLIRFSCCEEADSLAVRQFAVRDRFVRAIVDAAKIQLGLTIPISETSTSEIHSYLSARFEKPEDCGELIRALPVRRYGADFYNGKVKKRSLELREKCIFERDMEEPNGVRRCFHYSAISFIVRPEDFSDVFGVRLEDDSAHWFSSEERDLILADLLELADQNGVVVAVLAHDIPASCKVKGTAELEKDYEDSLLERINSQNIKDDGLCRQVLDEVHSNLSVAGAVRCTSKKPLLALIQALTQTPAEPCKLGNAPCFVNSVTIAILATMQKLAHSRACFEEAGLLKKDCTWAAILALVQSSDDLLAFAAVMALKAFTCYNGANIVQPSAKSEKARAGIEKLEISNRSCLLDSDMLSLLLGRLRNHALVQTSRKTCGLLTVHAIVDLLSCIIQGPGLAPGLLGSRLAYQATSTQPLLILSQELVGMVGTMCRLTRGPAFGLIRRGTMMLEWIMMVADTLPSNKQHENDVVNGVRSALQGHGARSVLQDTCRGYGQVLWQLYLAAASRLPWQQSLSERVLELLVEDNARSMALMHRILPSALIFSLSVRWAEPSMAALTSRGGSSLRPGEMGSRKAVNNWPLFWERLRQEIEGPELVWHNRAREELCSTLQGELEALEAAGGGGGCEADSVIWNDEEFYVNYLSLKGELKVGRYYVRFLIDENMSMDAIHGPHKLLGQLFHRFLTEADAAVQIMCLRAMARIYQHYNGQPFDRYALASLIRLLQQPCLAAPTSPSPSSPWVVAAELRDAASYSASTGLNEDVAEALLAFLAIAIRNDSNAQTLLLSCDLIPLLVRIAIRAHEHHFLVASCKQSTGQKPPEENPKQRIDTVSDKLLKTPDSNRDSLAYERERIKESTEESTDREEMSGNDRRVSINDAKEAKSSECVLEELKGLKAAISAISLLQTLIARKSCKSESGLRLRPLPLAVRLLTSQAHFPHVLSLLLSPHPVILGSVVRLLEESLSTAEPELHSSLLVFGPVPILLYALILLNPDQDASNSIVRLLRLFHISSKISFQQRPTGEIQIPHGASVQDWLTEGMCLILIRQEAWLGHFADALNWGSEEAECRPWVVWNEKMRSRLQSSLHNLLGTFIAALAQQPQVRFDFPSVLELPEYPEASEACWLDLASGYHHVDSDDGVSSLQETTSQEMGYYLDCLARHAVTGKALAVAAGDAEKLVTHIFEMLQASSALEPAQLKKTIKLLQVYAVLLQQHPVEAMPLTPLVRRLLSCCCRSDRFGQSNSCASAEMQRNEEDQNDADTDPVLGSANNTIADDSDLFRDTMQWALCGLATGGIFGGEVEEVEEEISLIEKVLLWNSIADNKISFLEVSVRSHVPIQDHDAEREVAHSETKRSIGLIRAWGLRCVASLTRSTAHAAMTARYFLSRKLCGEGCTHDEGCRSVFMEEIRCALLLGRPEGVQAAASCISGCCTFIDNRLSVGDDEDAIKLGLLLVSTQMHFILLWSLLKDEEKVLSATQRHNFSSTSLDAKKPTVEDARSQQSAMTVSAADDEKISLESQRSEREFHVAVSKVQALKALAHSVTRMNGTVPEQLDNVLRQMLTQPLYIKLQETDEVEWLRNFFGEYHRADVVWGAYNRSLLFGVLRQMIEADSNSSPGDAGVDSSLKHALENLRYRNVVCLTPVAGIYLELLPHDFGSRNLSSSHDSFDDLQRALLLGNDVYCGEGNLVPDGWPIEDLDVFVGHVIDMLAHGLNGSAPTTSQAQVALNVLLHLAGHLGMLRAAKSQSAPQSIDIITSSARAEVLLALLQLPQEDLSLRMLSDQALRLLAMTTMSQSAAQFCLSCNGLVPFLAHELSALLLTPSKVLPPNEAERLLHLLILTSNLAKTRAPSVQGALESMVQDGIIEAALLSILSHGTDENFAASGFQDEGGNDNRKAMCSAICAAASGLVQALLSDDGPRKGLVRVESVKEAASTRWSLVTQSPRRCTSAGTSAHAPAEVQEERNDLLTPSEGALVTTGRSTAEARRRISAFLPGWMVQRVLSGQAGGPMCVLLEDVRGSDEEETWQWGREARARAYSVLVGTLRRLTPALSLVARRRMSPGTAA